jgi:hypothetical protein
VRSGSAISPRASWRNTIADNGLFVSDFQVGRYHFSVLISPIARITIAIVEHDNQLDRPQ